MASIFPVYYLLLLPFDSILANDESVCDNASIGLNWVSRILCVFAVVGYAWTCIAITSRIGVGGCVLN